MSSNKIRKAIGRISRIAGKPPSVVLERLRQELFRRLDRRMSLIQRQSFPPKSLLRNLGARSSDDLWNSLCESPFPFATGPIPEMARLSLETRSLTENSRLCECAHRRHVSLLGLPNTFLGSPIDWHRDFKTGKSWDLTWSNDLDYVNRGEPSDVKIPWEISRLHWLMPVALQYRLDRNERHPKFAREILQEWIEANPYGRGINWACTMEVALRIISWTYLFKVFCRSDAWSEAAFRASFLKSLWQHAVHTERYLEISDINGNHYTADLSGLVVAGHFFGYGRQARQWAKKAWNKLETEIERQVFPDGVDFEASIPYHRLVLELFAHAALFRKCAGEPIPEPYRQRLLAMARFTAAYTRPDGLCPLWGDADDARALPFGTQPINDHRYLVEMVGTAFDAPELLATCSCNSDALGWAFSEIPPQRQEREIPAGSSSIAFSHGGVFILRNDRDYLFIDCGLIGLGGRGGHGHNDCLSIDLALDGHHLLSDGGSFVYTASFEERRRFQSTAMHCTPMVNGKEINRIPDESNLWILCDDAQPLPLLWQNHEEETLFVGTHLGYQRLESPCLPVRLTGLNHRSHIAGILDHVMGAPKSIRIPFLLAPHVRILSQLQGEFRLEADGKEFLFLWESEGQWVIEPENAEIAPSYGVKIPSLTLAAYWQGGSTCLRVGLAPAETDAELIRIQLKQWSSILSNQIDSPEVKGTFAPGHFPPSHL